jgi:hypothetical protein
VSYSNYQYFRTYSATSQVCTWTCSGGNFKANGNNTYTAYSITIPNQAQQFVGDGVGNWRPIGYNPYQTYS